MAVALPFWAVLWWIRPLLALPGHSASHIGPYLMVALVYPVLEEIVFRGGIQGFLMRQELRGIPGPVSLANIITSIVYAALHGFVWGNAWAVLVFFPSLLFGYFRERSGGLGASIVLHSYYNAGFILVVAG